MKEVLDNQRPVGRRWEKREATNRALVVKTVIVTCLITAVALIAGRYFFIDEAPAVTTPEALMLNFGGGSWVRVEVKDGIARVESLAPTGRFTLSKGDMSMVMDVDAMKRFVDAIGGIPVKVSERVEYTGADSLPLRIDPGLRRLDGDRIEIYVRRPGVSIANAVKSIVAGIGSRMRELEEADEKIEILVGAALTNGGTESDRGDVERLVRLLKGLSAVAEPDIAVRWEESERVPMAAPPTTAPPADPSTPPQVAPAPPQTPARILKVRILNGTGVGGIAARAASTLPAGKYDVIETTNADHFRYQTTEIRTPSAEDGAAVADALRLGRVVVVNVRSADVEVVLGRDARSRW